MSIKSIRILKPLNFLSDPKVVNSVNDRAGFAERKERLMTAGEFQLRSITSFGDLLIFLYYLRYI